MNRSISHDFLGRRPPMPDDMKIPLDPPPSQSNAPPTSLRVAVEADGMMTTYANFFRASGTYEELVLDFGLHAGLMTPTGPEAIHLTQRVIMSFPTAKRLLEMLARSIVQHEQHFGPIETDPQKRMKPQQTRG